MSTDTITRQPVTGDAINAIEYETLFTVYPDGTFREHAYAEDGVYAPEAHSWEGCDISLGGAEDTWGALTGMSGQYAYRGACMHESEFIGDGIARALVSMAEDEPRTFTVVTVDWMDDTDDEENYAFAWAILVKNSTETA